MRRLLPSGIEGFTTAAAAFGLVALVALLPLALDDFGASQFAYVGVYFIAICGLNILTGYTGQISLGHGAFMAVGGYTTAILAAKEGIYYLWTIPIAAVVAGVAGLLLAVPALRLSGLYLALATFGIAVAAPALIKRFPGLTGESGRTQFDLVEAPSWIDLSPNDWLYYLTWTIALVLLGAAWLLLRGRTGRAFRAVRDSEVAAVSFGIHLPTYKTLAFAVSAAYAGIAGALLAVVSFSFVTPEAYSLRLSIYLVVGTVAAGLGSLWGLGFGALLIQWLTVENFEVFGVSRTDLVDFANRVLQTSLNPKATGIADFVFGAVLVIVMLVLPTGAAGLLRKGATTLSGRLYTRNGSAR
jgi:branched-chain amino acid transport system permease protein